MIPIAKIISGGQTGVDRAALDAAIECGYPYGGWIPKGRRADGGIVPEKYVHLREAKSAAYPVRTELNVINSNATLIIYVRNNPSPGTELKQLCKRYERPILFVEFDYYPDNDLAQVDEMRYLLRDHCYRGVLNVAGPRESSVRGIYERAKNFMLMVLR